MILGRVFGWVSLLAGLAVLVRDGLVWLDTRRWAPLSLNGVWRLVIETGGPEGAVVPLSLWAAPLLLILGLAILYLSRTRRRTRAARRQRWR